MLSNPIFCSAPISGLPKLTFFLCVYDLFLEIQKVLKNGCLCLFDVAVFFTTFLAADNENA